MIEQHEGETTLKVKTHLDNMVNKYNIFNKLNPITRKNHT